MRRAGVRRPTARWRRLVAAAGFGVCAVVATLGIALPQLDAAYPPPLDEPPATSQSVVDREGRLLRAFTIEDGRWRLPVTIEEVDPAFVAMLLAYEDQRFASHAGVDPWAMLRAAGQLVWNGRIVSGASTLTMQVARLLEPRVERSFVAKLRQMARALQIERRLSKDEILTLYLTLAPYGGNLEGVRAASLAYFGKEPRALTVAESALLVALPQLPEARRPDRDPDAALAARNRVLERMADMGAISSHDAEYAASRPVPTARLELPRLAAHEADRVRAANRDASQTVLSIDREFQSVLETIAQERARALGPRISVAILVADHETGEVLARVGSADYFDNERAGAIDMTRAVRSPGSTLKPFIYGLAMDAGLAHPETLIEDRPENFAGYRPENFDMSFQGTVTVRTALEQSLNVPAISLLSAVGPMRLMSAFRGAGVEPRLPRDEPPGLAIGLGGVGLTLEDLVTLYTALPEQGSIVPLTASVLDAAPADRGEQLFGPVASWYVSDMLAGTPPPEHAAHNGIAFKTGTSYGYRDAWSIGFDGRLVVGVWVGRPDGTPVMGLSGRRTAAPILFEAFQHLPSERAALPRAPEDALTVSSADLPSILRRFTPHGSSLVTISAQDTSAPSIVHPPNGAHVDLSNPDAARTRPLVLKVQGGTGPYTWFANGAPVIQEARRRQTDWVPDTSGYSTFTVIDAQGRSDRVTVYVE